MSVFVVGGGIWYVRSLSRSTPQTAAIVTAVPAAARQQASDSDGDGLKDWEELLWKTDPNNPDTDGDGIPDGEAIKKSAVKDTTAVSRSLTESSAAALSPSDAFARDFLTNVVTLKQQGWSDDEIRKYLSVSMPPPTATTFSQKTKRTGADIVISPDASSEAVKKYANELGAILTSFFSGFKSNELALLIQLLNATDRENTVKYFSAFGAYRYAYANAAQKLLKTPVPAHYRDLHLTIINAFEGLSETNAGFQTLPNDFFAAPSLIEAHVQIARQLQHSLESVSAQLKRDRISIASGDPAYVFIAKTVKPAKMP